MTAATYREAAPADETGLAPELLLRLHDVMVRARCLEERLIRMNKQGDGFFWIGGPGEEALNSALGLLVHKGEGPLYDYLHFHYRSSATLLAMGVDPVDTLRQQKNTATDPYSAGRNFVNHYSIRKWNVCPVSSPIEVQYSVAPGTADPEEAVPLLVHPDEALLEAARADHHVVQAHEQLRSERRLVRERGFAVGHRGQVGAPHIV